MGVSVNSRKQHLVNSSTLNFTKRSFLESFNSPCHLIQQVFTVVHSFVTTATEICHKFLFFIFRNQSS